MPPIRRYLRITKYSVLECRIYLDSPAPPESWLVRKNDPALPHIIEAVRPYVLPKLREENERAQRKGKAKKGAVKDTVVKDDFEVAIFLTPQTSRHSILSKQKDFTNKPSIKSNSNKLTGWLTKGNADKPIDVDHDAPTLVPEDDHVDLEAIPEAPSARDKNASLFVQTSSEDEDDDFFQTQKAPAARRKQKQQNKKGPIEIDEVEDSDAEGDDDKKKLGLQTQYDGFSIYGSTLCLIVKRRGVTAPRETGPSTSQAMMENWVSTQVNMLGLEDD
ncbi:hypothetical protein BLS_009184 [Venturia inaequalis]|uniref:Uncharacterized protein n=1 Tax=Venturia inaequalis TaxID=5025 RepID=A0A8H3U437_VENIN|nr:hypothetical protein BLS_009184 [Venturia inaequalis]KAE9964392.1 hypothetical protein EG328_010495 [Venturia inaequalis]